MDSMKESINILDVFEGNKLVKICAPMVRYSKLQFRTLVRQYGCDLCFTPMILADSFCLSEKARHNEFTTSLVDTPVITQFAANTVHHFVEAAKMVSPFCSGVDLNCGCPQRWAKQQGLGCVMLQNPEVIADIVKQCRNQIAKPFTVSVKMRILNDVKQTVDICKQLERAGSSFLTIHGRTPSQLTGLVNEETLRIVGENIGCPLVVNGGVKTLEDCTSIQEKTGCRGVMTANGILSNPTMFSGSTNVSIDCIQKWLDICYNSTLSLKEYTKLFENGLENVAVIAERPVNLTFQCFHHHLVFMLEKVLPRWKRRIFNNLLTFSTVLSFLKDEFNVCPKLYDVDTFNKNLVIKGRYASAFKESVKDCYLNAYEYENNDGSYFKSKMHKDVVLDSIECNLSNIFLESN